MKMVPEFVRQLNSMRKKRLKSLTLTQNAWELRGLLSACSPHKCVRSTQSGTLGGCMVIVTCLSCD